MPGDIECEWMLGQAGKDHPCARSHMRKRLREGCFTARRFDEHIGNKSIERPWLGSDRHVCPHLPGEVEAVLRKIRGRDRGGAVGSGRGDGQQADRSAAEHQHMGAGDTAVGDRPNGNAERLHHAGVLKRNWERDAAQGRLRYKGVVGEAAKPQLAEQLQMFTRVPAIEAALVTTAAWNMGFRGHMIAGLYGPDLRSDGDNGSGELVAEPKRWPI